MGGGVVYVYECPLTCAQVTCTSHTCS